MDGDIGKIQNDLAQGFVPGGSNTASTTHDVENITFWMPATDCTFSYDSNGFDVAIAVPAGVVIGVPADASTLTLDPSTAIAYMRKDTSKG